MVEVRFACIPGVPGVRCVLDGVTKYSDSGGFASFFGISQGAHSYSMTAPTGWRFVSGEDVFGRPLYTSGTTVIEWTLVPGTPWPEDQPWMMMLTFEEAAPAKKPTTLTISVYPTSGTPPYDVTIEAYLTSEGIGVEGKTIKIYKNDSLRFSMFTDSSGRVEATDTVTMVTSYYATFTGDSIYEGCDTGNGVGGAGLGGLGLLVLLWLITQGGK